jgi:DNA repair protein SbcC/Rad50
MIPKRLTIKGIYSYQKSQVIDFTRLQEANIFGIFGKVGSGKSTILEAIMFVLYDEVQRLNHHQRHDLMNLKSNQLSIELEFEAQQKVYKANVSAKRDNKQKVGSFQRHYYEQVDNEWISLGNDSKIMQRLIGLKATDFKKAVVIPQNSFQEFLKMKGKERSTMMCEIFNLHEYNLDMKAKSLENKSEKALAELKGQLIQLGEVTAEMIEAKKFEIADCQQDVETFSVELEAKKSISEGLKQLKKDFEKQQAVLKKLDELKARKVEMELLERDMQEYEWVLQHFKPIWTLKSETARQFNLKNQSLLAKKSEFNQQESGFEIVKKNYLFWKPKYEERAVLQREIEDLKRVLEMQLYVKEREKSEKRVEEGRIYLEKQRAQVAQSRQEWSEKVAQQEALLASKPDISELNLVKNWFSAINNLRQEADNLQKTISEWNERVEGIEASKQNLLKKEWAFFQWNLPYQTKLSDAIQYVQGFKNNLVQTKSVLEDELAHFKASEQLETWAKNLKAGDNCPLCGGTHHPKVFNLLNTKQNVKDRNAQIKKIKEQVTHLDNTEHELISKLTQKNTWLEEAASQAKKLAEKQLQIQAQAAQFIWSPRYSPQDLAAVEAAFQTAQQLDKKYILLDKEVQTVRKRLDKETKTEQTYLLGLQDIKNKIQSNELLINALKKDCNTELMEKWLPQSETTLTAFIEKAEQAYNEIKTNYVKFEQIYNLANEKITSLKGYIEALTVEVNHAETDAKAAAQAWTEAITAAPHTSETAILQVLNKAMNVAQVKKTIESFQMQWFRTENEAIEGEKGLEGRIYLPQSYENSLLEVHRMNENLQKAYQKKVKLEMEMESNQQKLAARLQITEQVQRLKGRLEDLKTMRGLFKGNGFVDYASSVHLQNICRNGNERFMHLTQHQLQLEVNTENQFMVRDRMNDGKLRSADTLSGGQMFQASLSLALALADNIQSLTQAKQNFFFLDEGFGSLDKDSLQIVFETLKALRQENRIVGIISHVEEMQMEIDCHLKVHLNGEGSIVTASWEA